MKRHVFHPIAAIVLLACLSTAALAQGERREEPHARPGPHAEFHERAPAPRLQLDQRYRHDHYYPPHGAVVAALPVGAVSVAFAGGNWFFHGGVWFRPQGGRFIVSAPPFGIVVPLLPSDCATVWIGGMPYFYANGVYYVQATQGYTVVAPPPGAESAPAVTPAAAPQIVPPPVIYPRNGQSAAQTETDRLECNRWATTQPAAMSDASVFQRSVAACLDARGYTTR